MPALILSPDAVIRFKGGRAVLHNPYSPEAALQTEDSAAIAFVSRFAVDVKRKIDAQFITDLTVAYFLKPFNTEFVLGVDNFTDELAPLIYSGFNGTTDVRTYDGIGRFYWARLKYTIQ